MRAAVTDDFGQISLQEVDEPRLEGPHDVLVQVVAAGVCRTDLHVFDGALVNFFGRPQFPYVQGHETAGYVAEVGGEVEGIAPGDAVVLHPYVTCGRCEACRRGFDQGCTNRYSPGVDGVRWGGFAEVVRTGARAVAKAPAGADLVELSPYSDAGITAYHAVKKLVPRLVPGTSAVVLGVGGVGLFVLQLLKQLTPAKVLAIEAAESRVELARRLDADVVLQGTPPEHVEAVREATGGGADAVFDLIGSSEVRSAGVSMLANRGVFSAIAGDGELAVPMALVVARELTIVGNLVGTHGELQEVLALHAAGIQSRHVEYGLSEAAKVFEDLRAGRVDGRAVLIPDR